MEQMNWQVNKDRFPDFNDQDLEFLLSEFKNGHGEIQKDNPRRTVKKVKLKNGEYFFVSHKAVKIYNCT